MSEWGKYLMLGPVALGISAVVVLSVHTVTHRRRDARTRREAAEARARIERIRERDAAGPLALNVGLARVSRAPALANETRRRPPPPVKVPTVQTVQPESRNTRDDDDDDAGSFVAGVIVGEVLGSIFDSGSSSTNDSGGSDFSGGGGDFGGGGSSGDY